MLFNQLSHSQQKDVARIVEALDETVKDLRPITAEFMPDSSYLEHLELINDMVSYIVFNNDSVTDADELEDTLPLIAEALTFTLKIMADFINQDDTLPLEYVNDIYVLLNASACGNYHWQNVIKDNLRLIKIQMPDGENVSAAIFKAVLNTAFDCLMNDYL